MAAKHLNYQDYARRNLTTHLKTIEKHLGGARLNRDVEDLHHLRVSMRRLRNSLWIFKDLFPRRQLKLWKKSIRRVASATNAGRDLDIHIQFLEEFKKDLKEKTYRDGIEKFQGKFARRRAFLQKKIVRVIARIQTEKTFPQITTFLDKGLPKSQPHSSHLKKIADKKIHKRLRKFFKYETYVHQPKKSEELHQLRIAAKHLRYTLEAFEELLDKRIKASTEAAMNIQDILGKVHDYDVWIAEIGDALRKNRSKDFQQALSYLKKECGQERNESYKEFAAMWKKYRMENIWDINVA